MGVLSQQVVDLTKVLVGRAAAPDQVRFCLSQK